MLLSASWAAALTEEPERPYRLGLGLGCSFTGYRDEAESPINRYLNTLSFTIDGTIEKGIMLHTLNMHFFIGDAKNPAPYRGHNHIPYISTRANFTYALDWRLWGNQILPGYLGGAFRTILHYTGTNIRDASADVYGLSPPTGAAIFSLDLHIRQEWAINARNTLVLTAGVPVFGYAIRPPYAGYDELWGKYLEEGAYLNLLTLGEITSFHNYQAGFGDLKYYFSINPLLSPFAGLGFELSRIQIPEHRPRADAILRLTAGVTFAFQGKK